MSKQLIWADLHNHNNLGYGQGSLERSIRLAKQRLDLWGFTVHAQWEDIPTETNDPDVLRHQEGFAVVQQAWPEAVKKIRAASVPRSFLALPGIEWHSSHHGDRHVHMPGGVHDLPDQLSHEQLKAFAAAHGGLLFPHHLAYPPGARGVNWDSVDDVLSPVVEIFSEHGSSETDDGPRPMHGHSMSPRSTRNTWQAGLRRGLHLGVIASTDNHHGCPAAYNEGLAGLWVDDLTEKSIFAALRERQCIAVTGDRISVSWHCDGMTMGEVSSQARHPQGQLSFKIEGADCIDEVELIRNGQVWHRFTPWQKTLNAPAGRYLLRPCWGWGRMGSSERASWQFSLKLHGGRLRSVTPGFGSAPPGDGPDGSFSLLSDTELQWASSTSRAFPQPFDQLMLELEGDERSRLETTISCKQGANHYEHNLQVGLADLLAASCEQHMTTPPFTTTFQWQRALPLGHCHYEHTGHFGQLPRLSHNAADSWDEECLYLRVKQRNGQLAWSSPIWFAH